MNLSQLLQEVYSQIGMSSSFVATNGSTTTAVNGSVTGLDDPPEDDYAKDYTVFVSRDAGGAGAAPEGEYGRVSAYVSSDGTYTIATVSAAIAASDLILVCTNEIPLQQMIFAANSALKDIGLVAAVPDTSLTSAANQTEYTLPAAIQKGIIKNVYYQGQADDSNDNQWLSIPWKTDVGTYGSTGTLFIPQITASRTIKIVYDGLHARLTAYNSEISPSIPDQLMIAATTFHALRWYVNYNEGTEDFWLQRINEAAQDKARLMSSVRRVQRAMKGMPQWVDN